MNKSEIVKFIDKLEHLKGVKHFYEWSLTHLSDSKDATQVQLDHVKVAIHELEDSLSLADLKCIERHYSNKKLDFIQTCEKHKCKELSSDHTIPIVFYNRYIRWATELIDRKEGTINEDS